MYYNIHPRHLAVDDCVKRAVALATGMPYMLVQRGLNEHKRVTGVKRFYDFPNPRSYMENVLGIPNVRMPRGSSVTVGEFARKNPKGRYVLSVSGHWTACVDGVVYDTWDCTEKNLLSYYKVEQFDRIRVEKKYCYVSRREKGGEVSVTVYDGNGAFASRRLCTKEAEEYIASLSDRGFFNFDDMGEYI